MPTFVRQVPFDIEYDGQHVTGTLRPLLFADAIKLRAITGDREQAVAEYSTLLPTYVQSVSPVHDAAGGVVPMDEWLVATFYAGLVAQIMQTHLEAATIPNPPSPVAAHAD